MLDFALERTCGVALGATTRTRAPACTRLLIFDSAMVPAPTTKHGRPVSFMNIGNSFVEFISSLRSGRFRVLPASPALNVTCIRGFGQVPEVENVALGQTVWSKKSRHFQHAPVILPLCELRSRLIVDDEGNIRM